MAAKKKSDKKKDSQATAGMKVGPGYVPIIVPPPAGGDVRVGVSIRVEVRLQSPAVASDLLTAEITKAVNTAAGVTYTPTAQSFPAGQKAVFFDITHNDPGFFDHMIQVRKKGVCMDWKAIQTSANGLKYMKAQMASKGSDSTGGKGKGSGSSAIKGKSAAKAKAKGKKQPAKKPAKKGGKN